MPEGFEVAAQGLAVASMAFACVTFRMQLRALKNASSLGIDTKQVPWISRFRVLLATLVLAGALLILTFGKRVIIYSVGAVVCTTLGIDSYVQTKQLRLRIGQSKAAPQEQRHAVK